MKSLKIIIFRDTDKPYTIIIPSTVIVAVTFVALALVTLLSFSLVSNVMLYAQSQQTREQLVAEQITDDLDPDTEAITAEEPVDNAADDELEPGEAEVAVAQGDDTDEDEPEAELTADAQTEEQQPEETETPAGPEAFALRATGGNVQAQVRGSIINRENTVVFNAQVSKIASSSITFTGRFVASITDAEGNALSSYPQGVTVLNGEVENPQRGTTFSIRRLRNYNQIQLTKQSAVEPVYLMLFVYTEDGSQLLWREAVPLP